MFKKTSSTVTDVIVWHIEQSGADTFSATYEVDQQIKEGEQTSNVKATYTVKVYVDADGDMVIVQNPTLAPAVEKSDYWHDLFYFPAYFIAILIRQVNIKQNQFYGILL